MRTDLHLACAVGDLAKVMQAVEVKHLNINEQDKHMLTPLHVAARYGHAHVVAYLLKNGANRNVTDAQGLVAERHSKTDEVRRVFAGGYNPQEYYATQEDSSYVEL